MGTVVSITFILVVVGAMAVIGLAVMCVNAWMNMLTNPVKYFKNF